MKRCLLALLVASASLLAQAAETAQVTLTVTKFNPITPTGELRLVDYTAALKPHSSVSLVDREGMPTFVCKSAADFEVTIASTDGKAYRAIAITFQQRSDAVTPQENDPSGSLNHEVLSLKENKISFRNKALFKGAGAHFEFFILVQEIATGRIGLIDPDEDIEH